MLWKLSKLYFTGVGSPRIIANRLKSAMKPVSSPFVNKSKAVTFVADGKTVPRATSAIRSSSRQASTRASTRSFMGPTASGADCSIPKTAFSRQGLGPLQTEPRVTRFARQPTPATSKAPPKSAAARSKTLGPRPGPSATSTPAQSKANPRGQITPMNWSTASSIRGTPSSKLQRLY